MTKHITNEIYSAITAVAEADKRVRYVLATDLTLMIEGMRGRSNAENAKDLAEFTAHAEGIEYGLTFAPAAKAPYGPPTAPAPFGVPAYVPAA